MSIHHFEYLFGTDELLIKSELLVLMLSGNLDIINICLCFNTCAIAITQHLLASMQCDLWACDSNRQHGCAWCAPSVEASYAARGPKVTQVGIASETHFSHQYHPGVVGAMGEPG